MVSLEEEVVQKQGGLRPQVPWTPGNAKETDSLGPKKDKTENGIGIL